MTDWTTAALLVALTLACLEPILVVAVGPRQTRRMVRADASSIFEEVMRPAIRQELAACFARLPAPPSAEQVAALLPAVEVPKVPTAAEIAAAVRDSLVEAQAKAMEGKPDPVETLRGVLRDEFQAFASQLDAAPASVEEAASALGRRGADSRITFAAQEEQFQHAVLQQAGGTNGPLALAALEQAKASFPATYKAMVRQGPGAVPGFLQKAGIAAPGITQGGAGLL